MFIVMACAEVVLTWEMPTVRAQKLVIPKLLFRRTRRVLGRMTGETESIVDFLTLPIPHSAVCLMDVTALCLP